MKFASTNWDFVGVTRTTGRIVSNFEALNQSADISELDNNPSIHTGSTAIKETASGYEIYHFLEDGWIRTV